MAKGQHLSAHQQSIVKRYYENRDAIAINRLGELVTEIYLCESPAKAEKLWKQAEAALAKAGATKADALKVMTTKKPEALAELLKKL
jgi:FAD/FMN-containing dehydrogenase